MAQDTVDATLECQNVGQRRASIEVLSCEMPDRYRKDRGKRVLRTLLNRLRLRRSASVDISEPDPSFKVAYLGNVVTGWAKGDGCVEKPLATLWRNYTQSSRPDVCMLLTVGGGGLKATTKDHGLTEYWANRLTFCAAPSHFPRIFCWVYRHEGKRLRHELRCHAVLCSSSATASQLEGNLKNSLRLALTEFKKDKVSRQNARLSLVNSIYDNPSMPIRKILLSTGSNNYRPPLERSKSAPKLVSIEENLEEEDEQLTHSSKKKPPLRYYESASNLFERRTNLAYSEQTANSVLTKKENVCDSVVEEVSDKRKVTFSDNTVFDDNSDLSVDEKSNRILEQLAQESLSNEFVESCNDTLERNWFGNLTIATNFTTIDSDEGSLSSGCESASTVTSEIEQSSFSTTEKEQDESNAETSNLEYRMDSDFKVGGILLSRGRSLEKLTGVEYPKFYGLNSSLSTSNIMNEEVSLVPVGESQTDFSSLKVYKKRSCSDSGLNVNIYSVDTHLTTETNDEENVQDEGYDEVIDCASSISNIVLV
ncbi:hypothetical protein PPYR_06308 [Photinus pyralis]|uniref:PID domain-containing protein n=1 Tax=Photinus pyralis TaxID=7054 RepID=A0A5N4ATL7_PHOPY|nr:uncharacterized protein LOC116166350 [Photinus pyralis]XP_031337159.1 uncharacterized protein LOC116166350 [Photinus pyralis]XP_031337160.1 uncharacterized protein LOC116166350 [Photinus pyralis]XP_031337161.1 uncharacterized protein LOC116166350 [Photinus pyralis]XP_031337162.1 uncharacterized protein LOC116166350 [Photinus pyralis]XP_031337163.1 uncharacterized protein LOC116166350 [Photinus pyralis]XP_031337164.1 uncharacterized protein LOC116166350 [Photinus pyralis]XP_031337166.1 unc